MAKAKQPGSTGAEQGAQDEQNNPAQGDDGVAVAAAAEAPSPAELGAASPTPPATEESAPTALIKARVLVAGEYGQCNDVVEVGADTAKALPDVLDTSPEAVAYAESLATEN